MKIKLLVSRATATGAENRGQVVEVSDAEAVRMIEAGQAEAVRDGTEPERAVRRTRTERAAK
jgi:hypothetical protein